jgi:glycosyltransferase involved in cell wall biosynthesis
MPLKTRHNIKHHLSSDIVWIRQSFEHHSSRSGYDRLCSTLEDKIVSNTRSIWYCKPQRTDEREHRQRKKESKVFFGRALWRHKGTLPELKALLHKPRKKKIIHVMYGELIMGLIRFNLIKRDSKIVLSIHQTSEWWRNCNIPPRYFENIDAIIVLSLKEKDYFNQKTNGRAYYVPHGIDTDFFSAVSEAHLLKKQHRKQFRCLTVGQWKRDFRTLERVIHSLAHKDKSICFDIVISKRMIDAHPHKSYLNRILNHQNVGWYDRISDRKLRTLYKNANVLLLPLESAVANNSILEASASGLPIVTTDVGGTGNYTTDDFSILTESGSSEEMVDAVLSIKNTPAKDFFRSKKAREYVQKRYSWDIVSEKVIGIYHQLLNQNDLN